MKVWINPPDKELQPSEILLEGKDTLSRNEKNTVA